jgi:hypothetical protein
MTVRVYTSTEQTATKESEKDHLASDVSELRTTFDIALSDKRMYPVQEFRAFVKSARRYIQMTEKTSSSTRA